MPSSICQPGRGGVAAVAEQVFVAGLQGGVQIEAGHAPGRTDARLDAQSVPGDQHHRAMVLLGQPAGHDADHARVPAAVGQHQRGVVARVELLLGLLVGRQLDAPLQGLRGWR